ncbi:MAG: leucine-rich repeat protein [Coriobacteriia bacterium]|nr:leucine-rich repeat protein [Coriobacteriia bacterium]
MASIRNNIFAPIAALLCVIAAVLALALAPAAAHADEVTWTTDDFIYDTYTHHFYGCDYSRQFDVTGNVVSGFSQQGQEKLAAGATDLVIPARDPEGDLIVGVGPEAFKEMGLTSVAFPAGMMCAYDDALTHRITKRGNFVIAESAFSKNALTSVYLPQGVLALMPNAFYGNQITQVTLPQTIWWVENQCFAKNLIERVNFPQTTDFMLEMHGMPFAMNRLTSVRLPDFTEVVNMNTFAFNPGVEPLPADAPDKYKTYDYLGETHTAGLVYMYADTVDFESKDRIHHIDRTTQNTKSWFQKLVVNKGTPETQNPDQQRWTADDFTFDGQTITGLSASGQAKRAVNRNLVLPSYTPDYLPVTALASTTSQYGLFATADQGFDTVELPNFLETIGDRAFVANGLRDVTWAPKITSIGLAAFQNNQLSSVVLPNTLTHLGGGAFASNATLERVDLSTALTQIPAGAFGCSDAKHWMTGFTQITIPDGVTEIGNNAFAGNNFAHIQIPASVTKIGQYAFSTKNYLKTPCTLVLPEGLQTIGAYAFRNKIIESVDLPTTVTALPETTFLKEYSSSIEDTVPLCTRVFVSSQDQWNDQQNFPRDCYTGAKTSHMLYPATEKSWTPQDFTYGTWDSSSEDLQLGGDSADKLKATFHVVTGLSEQGEAKLGWNTDLVIPEADPDGTAVCGVGPSAFAKRGITSVAFPAGVTAPNDKPSWNADLQRRGNFVVCSSAFSGNKLTAVDLPEGTLAVMGSAFAGNQITRVSAPGTLFYLGNQSFARNQIADLRFPERTDFPLQIASMAFAQNQVTAVQLPVTTGFCYKYAFLLNPGMEPVVLPEDYSGSDAASLRKSGVVYLFCTDPGQLGKDVHTATNGKSYVQDVKEGSVPASDAWTADDFTYDGTTLTGWSATGRVKRLTNHDLALPTVNPQGQAITAIGPEAFRSPESEVNFDEAKYDYNCVNGIKTVSIPATVAQISDDAFLYNSLTSVTLPQGLERIGRTAFKGNRLLRLSIPDSVTELGDGCFAANNLVELKLPAGLERIPAGAFSMNIRMEQVTIPGTVTEIGDTAFAGARLTSLEIPASVTKVGRKAFHLHWLTELRIPGTLKQIGDNAFEGTYKHQSLTTLILEEGVESIGAGAFKEGLLTQVALPASLKTMGSEPFANNTGTGEGHVVTLTTNNPDHLAFNDGAKTHRVVLNQAPKTSISGAKVTVGNARYTGSARKPAPKVVLGGVTLKAGTDYKVTYKSNTYAGTATVTVTGLGKYTGTASKRFTVYKAYQPLKAKASYATRTLSAKKLKRAGQSVSNIRVTKAAKGKLTYANVSTGKTAKRFRVSSKGTVTVPKGVRKGTYTMRVKLSAAGTANYHKGSVTVTFKIKVK